MESKRLDSAAQAAGISLSYINAHGKPKRGISTKAMPPAAKPLTFRRSCRRATTRLR